MNCSPDIPLFATFPAWSVLTDSGGAWPSILRRPLLRMFASLASDTDQNRKLAALGDGRDGPFIPIFLRAPFLLPSNAIRCWHPSMQAALARANAPLQESLRHARALDPINRVSYLEARCYMLNTLLRDSDVMSMAHGLELRVPLIDHQLADKLLALPGAWKLDSHVPKPLLVAALKGALPNEIVHRKKQGFTLPFERWLRENLRPEVEAALQNIGQGPLGPLLNHDSVQAGLGRFPESADFVVSRLVAVCAGAMVRAEFDHLEANGVEDEQPSLFRAKVFMRVKRRCAKPNFPVRSSGDEAALSLLLHLGSGIFLAACSGKAI